MTNRKLDLPNVPDPELEQDLREPVRALREVVETREGRRGPTNERYVTIQDLIDAGLINDGDLT